MPSRAAVRRFLPAASVIVPVLRRLARHAARRPLALPAIALLALVLGACASRGVRPRATDVPDDGTRREVLAVVDRLFAAMADRDSAAMRAVFAPDARLFGMRTRPDGSTVTQALTWERFAAMNAGDTRARWTERAVGTPEVRVRGRLATVWAHYTFHFGETPSHCGVDAVQLLRTDAGWRIVSIADTYETTGCPWQQGSRE